MVNYPTDDSPYEIPQSRGVPVPVRVLATIGLVVIFYMGAISALFSNHFHIWPASDTVKVPLPGKF